MWDLLNGITTILAMLVFFGIVWWAFSSGRKKDNEEASRLPFSLEDEENLNDDNQKEEDRYE